MHKPRSLGGLTALLAFATPYAAQAQDTVLPTMLVSASRIEQDLLNAPIGATVIDGDAIRASGVADANEAIRKLGGVAARADLNGGREWLLDLRAYGDAAPNNMVVLIDGVRISEREIASARLSAIAPASIERIEIVRGGASVLWGEGATAGVIHVITRRPMASDTVHGSAQLALENLGGTDALLGLEGGSAALRWSLLARRSHSDGYRSNSAHDNQSAQVQLETGDVGTVRVRLSAMADDQTQRWPGALPLAQFQLDPTQTTTPQDEGHQGEQRWGLALDGQLGSAHWTIDLARRQRSTHSFQDFGFGFVEAIDTHSESWQVSPRLQWEQSLGAAVLETVAGLEWARWSFDRDDRWPGNPAFDSTQRGEQTHHAAYLRSELLLEPGTRLSAGLRRERVQLDYDELLASTRQRASDGLSAWELGWSQMLTPAWTGYARMARSFRVANVDELRFLVAPLRPQTARDVELGARWRVPGIGLDARLFQQRTQDEIAYDNNLFQNVNLDPVQRRGLELDGRWQVLPSLALSARLQRVQARLASGAYRGNELPNSARWQAATQVAWTIDARQTLELGVRWRGSAPFGNDWTQSCRRIPSAHFLDLGYRFEPTGEQGWRWQLGVDNVTNRQSYSLGYTNAACGAFNVYPDGGRRVRVSGSYRF